MDDSMHALAGLEQEVHAAMRDVMRMMPDEFEEAIEEDIEDLAELQDVTSENTFLDESTEDMMSDETFRHLMDNPPPEFWQTSVAVNLVTQFMTNEWQTELQTAVGAEQDDVSPELLVTPMQLKTLRGMR